MSGVDIVIDRESQIVKTPRVLQLEGIFDIPPSDRSSEHWKISMPIPDEWNVGLIVGPSGSGKTTIIRELFPDHLSKDWEWHPDKSILDGFPSEMSVKEIIELLSSVGFSSPPSWVRPFRVLSNGEQFRVNMARTLAEMRDLAVVDEFTSVVDRTVAQIGSAAIQKTIRKRDQRFIAVSCHYDIIDWIEPDWVYQPHTNEFYSGRYLHQRPKIDLTIVRVHSSAWEIFRKHHYLSADMNKAAVCFVAFYQDVPIAFQSWLHFTHPIKKNAKRISRTVVLPDYQGIGIGQALTDYLASCLRSIGYDSITTTAHPGRINALNRSPNWKMTKTPGRNSDGGRKPIASLAKTYSYKRIVASFEYVGKAMDRDEALKVWNGR